MAYPKRESFLAVLALFRPLDEIDRQCTSAEILLLIATETVELHKAVVKQCPKLPTNFSGESCRERLEWVKERPPCYKPAVGWARELLGQKPKEPAGDN